MPTLRVVEYTDPGCPFAWSAEPFLRRLRWLYDGELDWHVRMVGLSERPEEYLEKGFTPEKLAASFASLSREHGMPMATHERPRMAATLPACRAVVAVRERAGEPEARRLLRALRVHHFSGEPLDEPATVAGAARDAHLDPDEVAGWAAEPAAETALRADMAAARDPLPAALVLRARLAEWDGGLRYTCPSLEVTRLADGVTLAIPGFQPFAAYDVAFANLAPQLERRAAPESAEEALDWAGEPVATQEIAELLGVERDEAREALGATATEHPLGFDGLWTLPRYSRDAMAPSSSDASPTATSASASSASG